jgi:hypothetical protein
MKFQALFRRIPFFSFSLWFAKKKHVKVVPNAQPPKRFNKKTISDQGQGLLTQRDLKPDF